MKLRSKIQLIFGIPVAISLLAVGLFSAQSSYQSSINNVNDSMLTSADLAANQISAMLIDYCTITKVTGEDYILAGVYPDQKKADRIDNFAKEYGFTSGNILDKKGVSLKDGTDFSDRAYVKDALNGNVNISDITLSKYTNTYGFSIAAPLKKNGGIQGVVYYRLDIDFMQNITDRINISKNSYAYIVDESGNVIVHPNEELIGNFNIAEQKGQLGEIAKKMQNKNGNATYEYQGKKILCGYSPIQGTNGWSMIIAAPESDFSSQLSATYRKMILIDIIGLLVTLLFCSLFARYLANNISRVKDFLVRLSKGDFSKQMDSSNSKDELGVLQNTAVDLQNTFSDLIGQTNQTLGNMANYDLHQPDMKEYPGEFDKISKSVNSIKAIFGSLISQVQESASYVGVGSSQLADATDSLSQGTTSQANSIHQMASDIQDMTERIRRNSENETIVNEKLHTLDQQIQQGNREMEALLSEVNFVEEMSADIQKIVKTIDSIAFQTNVLALNAAVEAARAGEEGKGFAVVADEVGSLASKSGEASKQTEELIERCIDGIRKATESANSTSQVLQNIVEHSAEIAQAFEEISIDTVEQAQKSENIQREVTNISDVVSNTTATTQETAAATQVLSEQANNLHQLIQQYRI